MQVVDEDPDHPMTIGTDPDSILLNRFANITVCKSMMSSNTGCGQALSFALLSADDDNRIVLMPIDGNSDCQRDYINACYIDVCHRSFIHSHYSVSFYAGIQTQEKKYCHPRCFLFFCVMYNAYCSHRGYNKGDVCCLLHTQSYLFLLSDEKLVCTAGPLVNTVVDFWRLVWQERPPTIVMLTDVKEKKKVKCYKYWPDSGTRSFGPFRVTITEQQRLVDYTTRNLLLEVWVLHLISLTLCATHCLYI